MNSLCRSEHVNATLRNRRVTDVRQIGRGNGKFLRQQWNDRPQHPRSLSMPVQQNQGQPGTSGELVPLHPIDFRVARSDRRIRGLSGYRAHCDQNAKHEARAARPSAATKRRAGPAPPGPVPEWHHDSPKFLQVSAQRPLAWRPIAPSLLPQVGLDVRVRD